MWSRFNSLQLFATLWTEACQAPLSMEFSRQESWSGLPCPPPGGLPDPGIEPGSLPSLALADGFFPTSAIWEDPIRLKVRTKSDMIHLCVDIGLDDLMIEHLPGRRHVNIACPQRWGRICTTICDTWHIHFIFVLLLLKWDFTLFRIHAVSDV